LWSGCNAPPQCGLADTSLDKDYKIAMPHCIALIHKDTDSCYGVSFPDIPGVITGGDIIDEATQQAVEVLQFAAEDWTNPDGSTRFKPPSTIDRLARASLSGRSAFCQRHDQNDRFRGWLLRPVLFQSCVSAPLRRHTLRYPRRRAQRHDGLKCGRPAAWSLRNGYLVYTARLHFYFGI
jgi:antitoxin HicB